MGRFPLRKPDSQLEKRELRANARIIAAACDLLVSGGAILKVNFNLL